MSSIYRDQYTFYVPLLNQKPNLLWISFAIEENTQDPISSASNDSV